MILTAGYKIKTGKRLISEVPKFFLGEVVDDVAALGDALGFEVVGLFFFVGQDVHAVFAVVGFNRVTLVVVRHPPRLFFNFPCILHVFMVK